LKQIELVAFVGPEEPRSNFTTLMEIMHVPLKKIWQFYVFTATI